MDIPEVAKRSGVPASTLRYYESKGLIASLAREGVRRRFAPAVLDQLALIALIALGQAPSHADCPSFQRLLKAAASGVLEGRRERGALGGPPGQ